MYCKDRWAYKRSEQSSRQILALSILTGSAQYTIDHWASFRDPITRRADSEGGVRRSHKYNWRTARCSNTKRTLVIVSLKLLDSGKPSGKLSNCRKGRILRLNKRVCLSRGAAWGSNLSSSMWLLRPTRPWKESTQIFTDYQLTFTQRGRCSTAVTKSKLSLNLREISWHPL